MLVYYFVPFIANNRYLLLFWVSNAHNSVTVQNRSHVYMNFFDHKDLGNHLLQLCPKVVKHPVCRFQNVFLHCPTPRLHRFLSSHCPSCRFLSLMAILIPSIQFFFGLPCALFCFGIHLNAILGNLPSAILCTWPYHVSCFCSISFIIVFSKAIYCLTVTFLMVSPPWRRHLSPAKEACVVQWFWELYRR